MSTPFTLQLHRKPVLVVGGGSIAERKIAYLLKEKADVTLISPTLTEKLKSQFSQLHVKKTALTIEDVSKEYCTRLKIDWRSFFLVVVATDSFTTNEALAQKLFSHVSLINIVDNPKLSSFFFPAVVDRGALKISVTTSGKSPILAKKIRNYLSDIFGTEYDSYLEELHLLRTELQKIEPDPIKRKEILEERTKFPIG
ncbi:precorrin-2 dehydrogenase/sirohydrochlorin ferrochelatase family protein [Evansella halocellulosilytica]|uniref:precorrin-2 dehydrogenase/sirohydrochlorin ferrochelatase family protein n=1 Tax=Evansella halocellulosilytica TaxID=2011013 RepID=UPI000BB77F9F|nr:bifunctional precorrin-2 dehydrogenase/sirohydrochlorin ferrochelatase [Evansella halocellulosilytica]